MKLLIEIPDEQYRTLNAKSQNDVVAVVDDTLLIEAIRHGTPLPEHHGRLIDAEVACPNHTECVMCPVAIVCPICAAPTIIPATGNEFFNFDAPIIKKQTAMKEGEGE